MYNKVEYNGETLIDLTDTTAEESDVLQGKQFHDRSGALRNGNFVPQTYTAGAGINITNNKISANVDGDTIQTNTRGQLEVNEDKIASKDYVDTEIETNEYNDIFNIRVEWDRQHMPNAELIRVSFQRYVKGVLANSTISKDVKDIANGNVYLYKDTSDLWLIAVGTPPSSYHRLPMLVGNIATKTVNGESVKLFFRNGDDETQFDKLNSEKVDKVDCPIIETITLEEEVETIGRNYTISQNFTDCIVLIEFPQVTANITFNAAIYTNTYYPCCNAYYNNGISASGQRYYQIHSNIINGYRFTTSRQAAGNTKNNYATPLVFDFSDLYLYPERYQKITRISVNGVSGNLPIGTKVTILGNKEQ